MWYFNKTLLKKKKKNSFIKGETVKPPRFFNLKTRSFRRRTVLQMPCTCLDLSSWVYAALFILLL